MDPKILFPGLALVFGLLAVRQLMQHGLGHPAARTWATLALLFAAVSAWLCFAA